MKKLIHHVVAVTVSLLLISSSTWLVRPTVARAAPSSPRYPEKIAAARAKKKSKPETRRRKTAAAVAEKRHALNAEREKLQAAVKEIRAASKEKIAALRDSLPGKTASQREDILRQIEDERAAMKGQVQALRDQYQPELGRLRGEIDLAKLADRKEFLHYVVYRQLDSLSDKKDDVAAAPMDSAFQAQLVSRIEALINQLIALSAQIDEQKTTDGVRAIGAQARAALASYRDDMRALRAKQHAPKKTGAAPAAPEGDASPTGQTQ